MPQITLTVSQNVLVNHISEHAGQNIRSKCPPPACTHDLIPEHYQCIIIDDVPVKVKPSLHQAFSQVVDVMSLYFHTHFAV